MFLQNNNSHLDATIDQENKHKSSIRQRKKIYSDVLTCLHQHNISILLLGKLKLQQNLPLLAYLMRNSLQPETNFQGNHNQALEITIKMADISSPCLSSSVFC